METTARRAPGYTTSEPSDDPRWRFVTLNFEHSGNLPSWRCREFEISCAAPVDDPSGKIGILAMAFQSGDRFLSVHVAASAATMREYAASLLRAADHVDDGVGLQ